MRRSIYGIGKQWMWKFQHPEGQREINALHVPVGHAVRMLLTSEDVIHSFFVPAFRIHMDVLPERFTSVWFQATEPGTYHLFCSQYCGTEHAQMAGTVIVMEPADVSTLAAIDGRRIAGLAGAEDILKYRCISCHSADANAPRTGAGRTCSASKWRCATDGQSSPTKNYIRESILHPAAKIVAGYEPIMPTFEGVISTEELIATYRLSPHA